jgi:hypothetical protein
MGLIKKIGKTEILSLMDKAENLLREDKSEKAYEVIKIIESHNDILANTQLKLGLYRLRAAYGECVIQENYGRLGHR